MELGEDALKLLTTKGFDDEFFKNLRTSETHMEAYERTEQKYLTFFGRKRYKTFESYRKSRDQRIKINNL